MDKKCNIEIENKHLTAKQKKKIVNAGLWLNSEGDYWQGHIFDGKHRKEMFEWSMSERLTCRIRTFAFNHIIKTANGINVTRQKMANKAKRRRKYPKPVIIGGGFKCKR